MLHTCTAYDHTIFAIHFHYNYFIDIDYLTIITGDLFMRVSTIFFGHTQMRNSHCYFDMTSSFRVAGNFIWLLCCNKTVAQ